MFCSASAVCPLPLTDKLFVIFVMVPNLRNISKIRKYLTQDSAEILIHAFIGSKLDYCNSILDGIPKKLICKLQRFQNTAARIVTLTRKYDSITPIMFKRRFVEESDNVR